MVKRQILWYLRVIRFHLLEEEKVRKRIARYLETEKKSRPNLVARVRHTRLSLVRDGADQEAVIVKTPHYSFPLRVNPENGRVEILKD